MCLLRFSIILLSFHMNSIVFSKAPAAQTPAAQTSAAPAAPVNFSSWIFVRGNKEYTGQDLEEIKVKFSPRFQFTGGGSLDDYLKRTYTLNGKYVEKDYINYTELYDDCISKEKLIQFGGGALYPTILTKVQYKEETKIQSIYDHFGGIALCFYEIYGSKNYIIPAALDDTACGDRSFHLLKRSDLDNNSFEDLKDTHQNSTAPLNHDYNNVTRDYEDMVRQTAVSSKTLIIDDADKDDIKVIDFLANDFSTSITDICSALREGKIKTGYKFDYNSDNCNDYEAVKTKRLSGVSIRCAPN